MESPILRSIEEQVGPLSQAELLDLATRLIEIAKSKAGDFHKSDLGRYRGILKSDIDGLEHQRRMRDEWK